MNHDAEGMRAWLDAHGLADSELLHVLPNHGLDGADQLTETERRLLSGLLEARRAVVPGYRPSPLDRPSATQDRPEVAQPADLFNVGDGQPQPATVQPAAHRQPPAGRQHPAPPSRRAGRPERAEERER